MLKAILNIFFFFSFLTLSAQSSGYLHWQHLSTSDQLRNSANSFLFKDSRDFLWIGSMSGLQRYDGFEVKNYGSLPIDSLGMLGENIQGQMVEDENKDLWITTYQSLNHYDVETETFTPYPIRDANENIMSGFHSCGKTENTIWLLHKDSLRQFDLFAREFTISTEIGAKGFNRGTVRQFGDTVMVYAYGQGSDFLIVYEFLDGDLKHTQRVHVENSVIYSICPVSKEILLIGNDDGLQEITIGSSKSSQPILWQGKSLKPIVGISDFNEDEMLIAAIDGDLFRYGFKMRKLVEKLNTDFLKKIDTSNGLLTVLADKEQNVWVSSRNDGIYFAHPDKIKFANLAAGNMVTNLIQRKNGEIWVFANKKIIILNENGVTIKELVSDQMNYDNTNVYHVVSDQGDRLWTSYYYPEEQYVEANTYDFIKVNTSKYLSGALSLQDGRIIFTVMGEKGLFIFNQKNDQTNLIQIPDTDEIIESLPLYQNPQGDLVFLENNNIGFYDTSEFTRKGSIPYSGWPHDMLTIPGDSILWIGGTSGLVSFNYNTQSLTYHNKDIKLPKEVFGILPDDEGNLWLSTNDGIYRFTPTTNEIIAYDQADGVGSKIFSMSAHIKLRDGRLAFGGDNGLIIFDPKNIKSEVPLAVPQITDILIDGKKRPDLKCENTGAKNIELIEKLCLKPKDNKLEFHFVAIEYSSSKENLIRYRLSPEETEWKIAESGGKCQYTNIEHGDYTFEIQAANSDGVWNEKLTDSLVITVLPPLHKTLWFKALACLCLILIGFGINNSLQKKKRRKEQVLFENNMALEKQRLRIARDMHDDLGSRLSAISLKTAMLETKFENPKWKKEMGKLTKDAQEISITIRETIWAVDARNDSLGKLIQYVINYAEELFDGLDINCAFEIAEKLPDEQMVSGKIRRMVFLASKEILNNIVKHAQASKVMIEMKMEKDRFILIITDNGIGFNFAEKNKGRGNGLDNMRYRMEKIDGTCRFLKVAKGTSIELNFNFLS